MSNESETITRIIACAVFKPALEHIRLGHRYPNLRSTYITSDLHMRPQELRNHLLKEINAAKERKEHIVCLYGDCFPGIDGFCREHCVTKVPGHYCYEMLLGSKRFKDLIDEITGTYFLERELILNFKECCMVPLELYDEEMRKYCFQHYKRLLYVRQPSDPDLIPKAGELARLLDLSLEIIEADYAQLERTLVELIGSMDR